MARGRSRREGSSDDPERYTRGIFFTLCVVWLGFIVLVYVGMLVEGTSVNDPMTHFTMAMMLLMHLVFWVIGDIIKFRGDFGRALARQFGLVAKAVLVIGALALVVRFVLIPAVAFVVPIVTPWVDAFVDDLVMFIFVVFIMPVILFCVLGGFSGRDLFDAWALHQIFKDEQRADSLSQRDVELIEQINDHISAIQAQVNDLVNARKVANKICSERSKAIAYHDTVVPLMDEIRYHIDKLELIVDNEMWTLPKYRELLFLK